MHGAPSTREGCGDDYERLRARGNHARAAGNVSEAIELLGDAVCLHPERVAGHLDLGACFEQLGRTEVARRIYEHAGRIDPASPLVDAALAGLPPKPAARHAFEVGQVVHSPDNAYRVLERRMGAHGAVSIVRPEGRSSFFDRVGYRRYVLKTFNVPRPWSDEDRERFANEARTWVMLDRHPNIVTALWVERVEQHHCLLLEHVAGGDLDTALADGPLDPERALRLGLQFCDGMEYAGRTFGIVHGDVKAANCLLTADDTLKVTDFGLAQVFGPAQAVGGRLLELKPEVRAIYMVPGGTRNYRAPEQSRFGARVDVRTDIYGFGVLLYQMVTGDLPVSGSIAAEHIRAATREGDLPAGLRQLILACVEPEPHRRPRSFRAVRGELQAMYELVAGRPAPPPAKALPGDRDLYIRRGVALDELGRHEEALTWFGKALEVAPGDGWALHNKALTLRALGRRDEALACLDQALKRYPGYTQALGAKAKLLTELGRHQEALECLAQAHKGPSPGPGYVADMLDRLGDAAQNDRRYVPRARRPTAHERIEPEGAANAAPTADTDAVPGPTGTPDATGAPGPTGADSGLRYSPGTVLAWQLAAIEARAGGAEEIELAHLMLGVCKLADRLPPRADAVLRAVPSLRQEVEELRGRFRRADLDVTRFRRRLRAALARRTRPSGGRTDGGVLHRTPAARRVFRRAEEQHTGPDAPAGLVRLLRALLEIPAPPWAELAAEMGLTGRLASLLDDDGGTR